MMLMTFYDLLLASCFMHFLFILLFSFLERNVGKGGIFI